MAVNGLFTYEDRHGGKSQDYYLRPHLRVPFSITSSQSSLILNTPPTTTTDVPTSYFEKLVTSTESTEPNKFADVIPFTYFYWLLVVLAILLILTLIIVFICYCRAFLINYRTRRRESLPSYYRYRAANRRVHANDMRQPNAPQLPSPIPLPTPPCPSKSLECLNNQLHRQDLDIVSSPSIARLDIYPKGPLSTFTSSTSNLPSTLHSHLSARSSDPPLKVDQIYESQRTSMAFDFELTNDSLNDDTN